MRIVRVAAYRQLQPFRDGAYVCRGRSEDGTDSTIVVLESDEGLTGAGEMAPLGAFYAPAFAAGTRAGVAELAPLLLGADPREPRRVRRLLDAAMLGQPFVKSALDMAVHDLAAQAAGVPLCTYLGGRYGATVDLYRSVSQAAPDVMARAAAAYVAAGYRRIQVKVGGDPGEDVERVLAVRAAVAPGVVLFCDANGAWTTARRARSCAPRAISRSRSSSRACRTTTAARCARTARIRSCWTSASTRCRRCSRPTATASPTA